MNTLCVLFIIITTPMVIRVCGFEEALKSYHTKVGIPRAAKIREAEKAFKSTPVFRVQKGFRAPNHAYPYLAGLLIDLIGTTALSVCGSSILTTNRLVTAAHCWVDNTKQAAQFTVVLGSNTLYSGGVRMKTTHVITHPGWNPNNFHNDIAMIFMLSDIIFNDSIHPIDLPSGEYLFNDFVGQEAIAAGFGNTNPDPANQIDATDFISYIALRVITNEECRMVFRPEIVPSSKVCTDGAGGVGTCHGDSGGPLVVLTNQGPILIGISSFGSIDGCGLGHPSAFTRVTDYYDYIQEHLY